MGSPKGADMKASERSNTLLGGFLLFLVFLRLIGLVEDIAYYVTGERGSVKPRCLKKKEGQ